MVPASAGLLANDPTATAVLDPDAITIDAKYGTLDVNADGSFVFDPSPDIVIGHLCAIQLQCNQWRLRSQSSGTCQDPGLLQVQTSGCERYPLLAYNA